MNAPRGSPSFLAATLFFVACFLAILYFLYAILEPFLTILIWAAVLTVVFYPLFGRLAGWCRGRRGLASILTCLLVLLMIVIPVVYLTAAVARQSLALYHQAQTSLDASGRDRLAELEQRPAVRWALEQVRRRFGIEEPHLREGLDQTFRAVSRFLVARGPSLIRGAGEFVFSFLLMFISMFFFFRDGPTVLGLVRELNPLPEAYERELLGKFRDVSYAAVFGSILTALVQGFAGSLLFLGLGIPSPLFWGSLVAFVSLIPIVGAFLVWLPWSAYLLLSGDPARAAAMLGIGGLVVSSIDNVLKPMIIRGRTDMHPLLVFLSVLGGMQAFGFIGILLGPLVIALFLSFLDFYRIEFRETLEHKLGPRA
jgi:predicted PurR-regulated permease PerM